MGRLKKRYLLNIEKNLRKLKKIDLEKNAKMSAGGEVILMSDNPFSFREEQELEYKTMGVEGFLGSPRSSNRRELLSGYDSPRAPVSVGSFSSPVKEEQNEEPESNGPIAQTDKKFS